MSIPINTTAYAAVLTTGVERWHYPIFLDQLHYFIHNVEDRDNSKYCNNDAKDKAPTWTKRRGQMSEWLRKEEVSARGRTASEDVQMVGRKRIIVWESGENNTLQKALTEQKPTLKRFHCPSVPPVLTQPRRSRWGSKWTMTLQAFFSNAAERADQRCEHAWNETPAICNKRK